MPAGRPTDYQPSYCEELISLMAEGLSLTAAAAELGFHRQRVYEWAERHEELADAINLARGKRVLFLEKRLLNDGTPSPAMTGTIFALKNADAEEWREKVVNEHAGKDGGPIQAEHSLSDESAVLLSEVLGSLRETK